MIELGQYIRLLVADTIKYLLITIAILPTAIF